MNSRFASLIAAAMGVLAILTVVYLGKLNPQPAPEGKEAEIYMIPRDEAQCEDINLELLERQVERKLKAEEKRTFAAGAEGPWRVFEDDLLSFEIPASNLLKVEVVKKDSPLEIRVVGGAVGTTDHRFDRAYRMTVGPDHLPYGVILLSDAEWLDEGVCFCGAVVLKRLLVRDGALREYSLLNSGDAKKVQVLSADGLRAVLFEWTHSVILQETYVRIGDSIQLKSEAQRSRQEWIEKSKEYREGPELVGWVSPGDSKQEITTMLGRPSSVGWKSLEYDFPDRFGDGTGWEKIYQFPMERGRFTGFQEGWLESGKMEPLRGSLGWAMEATKSDRVEESVAREIFEAFLVTFQGDETPGSWNLWCHVIDDLEDEGYQDERVLPLIEKRFLDPTWDQNGAGCVLEAYEAEGREKLFAARLKMCLDQTGDAFPELDGVWNLLTCLSKDHPKFDDFVRRAADHPSTSFQGAGVARAYELPLEEARAIAKAKSTSGDRHVRSMTEGLYERIAQRSDIPDIRAWHDREKDEHLKKELEALLKSLE